MSDALVFDERAGRIVVPPQTLATIVSVAVEQGGARVRRHPRRSLVFELGAESSRVEVGIVAPAGSVLPELAARVQDSVHEALELMCELHELTVDVTVEEIA
jgi:uncharacterized alkaline shock family protein YloU